MPKRITSATPAAARRIHDISEKYLTGRNISAKPGAGEVRIKISHDNGVTFDTVETINGQTKAGNLGTYDLMMEFECTGNAVMVLSD